MKVSQVLRLRIGKMQLLVIFTRKCLIIEFLKKMGANLLVRFKPRHRILSVWKSGKNDLGAKVLNLFHIRPWSPLQDGGPCSSSKAYYYE